MNPGAVIEQAEQPPQLAQEAKGVCQRAAAALALYGIVVNLLQLGLAVAAGSAFQLQLAALIVAAMLALGGLKTAEFIRWCTNMFIGALAVLPVIPFIEPFSLIQAYARQQPVASLYAVLTTAVEIALAFWLAGLLKSAPIVAARAARSTPLRSERWARASGAAAALTGVVAIYLMLHGATARKAADLAAREFGPDYNYYTRMISATSGGGQASRTCGVVVIWNDDEGMSERTYCW